MRRKILLGMFLLQLVTHANTIADFTADYSPVTPSAGWQYLRSEGADPVGTSSFYVPLVWDSTNNFYDVNGSTFPTSDSNYTLVGGWVHPGPGQMQSSGSVFDQYVLAAYTIQPGEGGSIGVSGFLAGLDSNGDSGNSNGWALAVYVGDVQFGPTVLIPWSLSSTPFARSLGNLNAGDTIYVGVGPNGEDFFDAAQLDFQITSTPEPATLGLLALGMIVIALKTRLPNAGWRSRH